MSKKLNDFISDLCTLILSRLNHLFVNFINFLIIIFNSRLGFISLGFNINHSIFKFKGTVSVTLIEPPCKDDNV